MNLAARPWIIAVILGLLALSPAPAHAVIIKIKKPYNKELAELNSTKSQAIRGSAGAQYMLGLRYRYGKGVDKDEVQAVYWWRKAAEQGYHLAQYSLGVCYKHGTGVDKDEVEAVKWYRMAADQGLDNAQYSLGVCYSTGTGVDKDEIEAFAYWKLASHSDAEALRNLGIIKEKLSESQIATGERRALEIKKGIDTKRAAKAADAKKAGK